MRATRKLPEEFYQLLILGFEDDDAGDGNDDEEDESEDKEEEDDKGGEKKDTEGLKSALNKERRERRRLEKENKRLAKLESDREEADKDEVTKATDKASKADEKATRLAMKLKDRELENAIIKLAGPMDFADIDDVLHLIDRDAIDIDQDEDDPSDVEVDEKTVQAALDALKKKKPHLIKTEPKGPPKSGSKMNGGMKTQEQLDEETLKAKYPALRR